MYNLGKSEPTSSPMIKTEWVLRPSEPTTWTFYWTKCFLISKRLKFKNETHSGQWEKTKERGESRDGYRGKVRALSLLHSEGLPSPPPPPHLPLPLSDRSTTTVRQRVNRGKSKATLSPHFPCFLVSERHVNTPEDLVTTEESSFTLPHPHNTSFFVSRSTKAYFFLSN